MKITDYKKKGQNITIYLENEPSFIIDYELFLKHGISAREEISTEEKSLLELENEFLQTKKSAYRYLARRMHSRNELKRKLLSKKYKEELINRTLDYLTELKYLDDNEFARKFTEEKILRDKNGLRKIIADLRKKGISLEIISEIKVDFGDVPTLHENALFLAKKKMKSMSHKNYTDLVLKQKIYSFLLGKGYEYELILGVIDELEINN